MTYEESLNEFKEWLTNDKKAQALWERAAGGKADYKDAYLYADRIGSEWGKLLVSYKENFEEHLDDIEKSIRKVYSETSYFTKTMKTNMNKNQNIGMKALEPRFDQDRLKNFMEKLKEEQASWLLDSSAMQNIARQSVSDSMEANARIQSKAGLKTTMIRHEAEGGCCEWCKSLADGKTYSYGEQPDDFFSMHKDCGCYIEYITSKGTEYVNKAKK